MRDVRRVDRCDSGSHKIKKFLFYKIEIVYYVGAVALEKCFYYFFWLHCESLNVLLLVLIVVGVVVFHFRIDERR